MGLGLAKTLGVPCFWAKTLKNLGFFMFLKVFSWFLAAFSQFNEGVDDRKRLCLQSWGFLEESDDGLGCWVQVFVIFGDEATNVLGGGGLE